MIIPFFKTFEEMTREDYAILGLKSGLEIHQQLLTKKKLFCRCPAGRYNLEFDAEILRHMRPTLSELGEYDGTALMEFKTKKDIIYQINHQTVCTYEMDDTPPFEINDDALDIALETAMLLNTKLVSEIHIARKQYLDGSIPTGFQRTTIVGIDGWIPYKGRKIGITQIGLEEDSCREVSDIGHTRTYRADRLGMPLIETVTDPDMKTPWEVAEVANILRYLVRSTGKVRTGIGAARQDVNVSIRGGTRIEIKGVDRIKIIPRLIYNEAMRQFSLLQIKEELLRRGITTKSFTYSSEEVTKFCGRVSWDPIRRALKRGEKVFAVKLDGFSGLLSHPTQSGKVFSKEISDRVRVIACLTRLPNMLTSESTEESIEGYIWSKIRNAVNATSRDAIILVWGDERDTQTAIKEIAIRAKEATIGIPSETRQALIDGTNGFERILPGPERMYPDTDLPPLEIKAEHIDELQKNVPRPLWEREHLYSDWGVPDHLITEIASTPRALIFEELVEMDLIKPLHAARLLYESTKHHKRKGLNVERLTKKFWIQFFKQIQNNPNLLEDQRSLLKSYLNSNQALDKFLDLYFKERWQKEEIPKRLKEAQASIPSKLQRKEQKFRYLMGQIMDGCRGIVSGSYVQGLVHDAVNKRGQHV